MPWGVAAAVVGGAIASDSSRRSSNTQADAAARASELQGNTSQQSLQLQREQFDAQQALAREQMAREQQIYQDTTNRNQQIYDTAREDGRLGREVGQGALRQLWTDTVDSGGFKYNPDAFKNLEMDPGWQFRQSTGENALRRQINAGNGVYSGAAAKALTQYNSNLASQEYGAAYGRAADAEARRKDEYQLHSNQLSTLAGIGQTANSSSQVAGQNFGSAAQAAGNSFGASGQSVNSALGAAGQAYANSSGNILGQMATGINNNTIGAANAAAGNSMYQGNTWANVLNQGASAYGRNNTGFNWFGNGSTSTQQPGSYYSGDSNGGWAGQSFE